MAGPDAEAEQRIAAFASEVRTALGDDLVALALHGSAAGDDWVAGRSDLNAVLVVPRVTLDVLTRLAPVIGRFTAQGFAPPAIMDHEYLARARDTFPMELDDIRRQHRLLAGRDVFSDLVLDPAAVRRECEYEARAKLLRLRALFLEAAETPAALERLMLQSAKSFLVLLRHLVRLHREDGPQAYGAVVDAGERFLGPLPTIRRLLDHRRGVMPVATDALRAMFGSYLAEVERIVEGVDRLDA